jgi:hypothetical protein
MSAWSLLAVPLCLVGMVLLLAGVSWFEQRMLSPRSMIMYTARARHVGPDTVEMFVTKQSEELLRNRGLVRVSTKPVAGAKDTTEAVSAAAPAQAAPVVTRP